MKKTYSFKNMNGSFICFIDYDTEADFDTFLKFICGKLNITLPPVSISPYSVYANIKVDGNILTASYNSDAGCYLFIPTESDLSPEELLSKIYE